VLTFLLIGVAIGAITGVPVGPANLAVIDAAYRHTMRRAIGVAIGAAVGDTMYAGLGIVGVGPLLVANPAVPPVLYMISGVILFGYGALTVRSTPVSPAAAAAPKAVLPSQEVRSGMTVGLALILLNPAAIVTWVVVVGPYLGGADPLEGLIATAGVGIGSFGWFWFVAYLTTHGKRLMGDKAIWITRGVGLALCGYGAFSIIRALMYWLG
jgi:threonine/homoserine/homoserine lactone efflux protein